MPVRQGSFCICGELPLRKDLVLLAAMPSKHGCQNGCRPVSAARVEGSAKPCSRRRRPPWTCRSIGEHNGEEMRVAAVVIEA